MTGARKSFFRATMVLFGASGGVSFFIATVLLSYRMSAAGIDTSTIGNFAWAVVPYNIRFLWTYLIDYVKLPCFPKSVGQRRSWGYLAHTTSIACFCGMGWVDPAEHLCLVFALVLVSSFASAVQDVVSDAYRFCMKSILPIDESVPLHTVGFRCGKLLASSAIPTLASVCGWFCAYNCVVIIKIIAFSLLWFLPEPRSIIPPVSAEKNKNGLHLHVIFSILKDVCSRPGALVFLGVFLLVKAIDVVLGPMETYFLGQLGVSSRQYGMCKGGIGGTISFIGVGLAGYLSRKFSINRALKFGAFCLSASGLLSLVLMRIPISAMCFTHVFTGIAAVQEFFLGMVLTLAVIYVSSFCKTSDGIYDFTMYCSLGSIGRTLLTFLFSKLCNITGWAPIFFLPLILYIPLFWLLRRDFSSKQACRLTH